MEKQREKEWREAKASVERMIKEAEQQKAAIYKPPGKCKEVRKTEAEIDNECFMSTSHVDPILMAKIARSEYVDLQKVLPKEKILHDDRRVQVINREGGTFFVPTTEREAPAISSLKRWEQAFEIFASIYVKCHPDQAAELFEYISVIRNAAATFIWDNVYTYDCKFRRIIEKYPYRRCNVICQQGWSLYLKEKFEPRVASNQGNGKKKFKKGDPNQPCWRFNKGKCSYGSGCRFEHKCANCGKTDHGTNLCTSSKKDKDKK